MDTSEIHQLRLAYQEIIEGCSPSLDGFFVKHLDELESIEVSRKRDVFLAKYRSEGIPTEKERLTILIESGEWSSEKENDIVAYKQTISDNEKSIQLIIPQQQEIVRKAIDADRQALWNLLLERRKMMGTTAEDLTEQDLSYFTAYLSIYKDRSCTERVFTKWEDFEALEEAEMSKFLSAIERATEHITNTVVNKIAVLPFFLNAFSYAKEAVHVFLSKPLVSLTHFQILLFSSGSRNINILNQSEGHPPDLLDNSSVADLVKWYDTQYSIIVSKRKESHHS